MAAIEPQNKSWTCEEYRLAASAGVFIDQRVELVQGDILMMSPMNPRHAVAVQLVAAALQKAVSSEYSLRIQLPMTIGNASEPEPDVAVVAGPPRDFLENHPRTAALVVEISDTTLAFDRAQKRDLYAAANVLDYWVLNLSESQLEIHTDLASGRYRRQSVLGRDELVQVALSEPTSIQVGNLIP